MNHAKPVVAVDLLGSDKGPEEIAEGVRMAYRSFGGEVKVVVVGPPGICQMLFHECRGMVERIVVAETTTTAEHGPYEVLHARESSVAKSVALVAAKGADAVLSFGDTRSAVMWAARLSDKGGLGLTEGIARPPLALLIPTIKQGQVVLLDAGANTDCSPELLVEFAQLGRAFASVVMSITVPRVGLLANGEEDTKGDRLTKATHEMLRGSPGFAGNVQASDIISGDVEVVVADGFSGNIAFKAMEGGVRAVTSSLKRNISSRWYTKLGALLLKPALSAVKRELASSQFGAMPLLGTNGIVMIGHGNADSEAVMHAIRVSAKYADLNLVERMKAVL